MAGVKCECPRNPRLTAEQRKKIAELYRNGSAVTVIQARFGKKVMGELLRSILEEHGVPHRGRKNIFVW